MYDNPAASAIQFIGTAIMVVGVVILFLPWTRRRGVNALFGAIGIAMVGCGLWTVAVFVSGDFDGFRLWLPAIGWIAGVAVLAYWYRRARNATRDRT